ncbi:hypothetical protein MMC21_007786 [Puttea exsequens]|nr:hypothetical protein [Puttea exsequens]
MASKGKTTSHNSPQLQHSAPSKPLPQRNPEQEKVHRRDIFLRKVRQASDDRRWESRSEQILHKDFLSQQKEWEQAQRQSASEALTAQEDEVMDQRSTSDHEVDLVDHIVSQEDQEFEALISLMQNEDRDQENIMSVYGSDEEEYDELFMEVVSKQEASTRGIQSEGPTNTEQSMDVSMG